PSATPRPPSPALFPYTTLFRSQPRNADAMHLLALLEQQANHHQRAFELLTAAIAIDPSPAEFHYNLGNSLLHLNRSASAAQAFEDRKSTRLTPVTSGSRMPSSA